MSELRVRIIDGGTDLETALGIREIVFIQGQDVPRELEVDGLDPECTHFLAERLLEGRWTPVGTARLRPKGGVAKAERVAVLAEHRGLGLGLLLMAALEDEASNRGFSEVILNAQVQVVPFYQSIGYQGEGPEFEEAGIQHLAMRRRI